MKEKVIDFGNERVSVLFKKLFFPTLLGMLSMSAVTTIDGIFVGTRRGQRRDCSCKYLRPSTDVTHGCWTDDGGRLFRNRFHLLVERKNRFGTCDHHPSHAFRDAHIRNRRRIHSGVSRRNRPYAWLVGAFAAAGCRLSGLVFPVSAVRVVDCRCLVCHAVDGAPKLAMWCSIIAAAVNVVLDWLFIFPLGWGVMGAAFATSLSCLAGAAVAMGYLLFYARDTRLHSLRPGRKRILFFFYDIGMQCKIGSSALLGELTMAILLFIGNHVFMRHLGDDGVGAFGVSCYYLPFVFMIGNAIAQSAQPIISYNFGTGSTERVRSALRVSVFAALVCGVISTAAFILFPELLVGLFLRIDNTAARIAIEGFPYYGTVHLLYFESLHYWILSEHGTGKAGHNICSLTWICFSGSVLHGITCHNGSKRNLARLTVV